MPRPLLHFWFEFASTYSYLSVMRLPALAQTAGIEVKWRPLLLGPIFARQGWSTSPFNIYPEKGRYMWRDMERRSQQQGLAFSRPKNFPQNGLHAARIALRALETDAGIQFCQAVYQAQFVEGLDISDADTLRHCLAKCDLPDALLNDAQTTENKDLLRKNTEEAQTLGLFGAPSFTIGKELFWGDDRLEDAMEWARTHG